MLGTGETKMKKKKPTKQNTYLILKSLQSSEGEISLLAVTECPLVDRSSPDRGFLQEP